MALFVATGMREFVNKRKQQDVVRMNPAFAIPQTHVYISLVRRVGRLVRRRIGILV
jgi:hypothetical protein